MRCYDTGTVSPTSSPPSATTGAGRQNWPADPPVTAILVDPLECNERAQRFYERLGFEFVVRRCFDDDYCAVYRLTRPAADFGARKTA